MEPTQIWEYLDQRYTKDEPFRFFHKRINGDHFRITWCASACMYVYVGMLVCFMNGMEQCISLVRFCE